MTPSQRERLALTLAAAHACQCDPTLLTSRWTERMLELVREGVLDELLTAADEVGTLRAIRDADETGNVWTMLESQARRLRELEHLTSSLTDQLAGLRAIKAAVSVEVDGQGYYSEWTRYSDGNPSLWRRLYRGYVLYASDTTCMWWVSNVAADVASSAESFEAAKAAAERWAEEHTR